MPRRRVRRVRSRTSAGSAAGAGRRGGQARPERPDVQAGHRADRPGRVTVDGQPRRPGGGLRRPVRHHRGDHRAGAAAARAAGRAPVEDVIMVGGSSRIPVLAQRLPAAARRVTRGWSSPTWPSPRGPRCGLTTCWRRPSWRRWPGRPGRAARPARSAPVAPARGRDPGRGQPRSGGRAELRGASRAGQHAAARGQDARRGSGRSWPTRTRSGSRSTSRPGRPRRPRSAHNRLVLDGELTQIRARCPPGR